MDSFTQPACAKINLHLAVLGTRPDGYHELETLFERVDLADHLTVHRVPGKGVELQCDSTEVPQDATNLAVRAAELFRGRSGWTDGIRLVLEKRIPVGGGLGGGSSDAAAVLRALQKLSGEALSPQELTQIARQLGSDVPFFLLQGPWGLGRGRGDEVEPLDLQARLWHLLVTPDFPIPTQQVYQALTTLPADGVGCLTPSRPDVTLLLRALRQKQVSQVGGLLFNALEPTVEVLYPAIRHVKAAVETLGLKRPSVSGSGSTVFAVCASGAEAEAAAKVLRQRQPGWRVFVAATAY